jgi:propionyl-CoA carboxylase alpha chain
MLAKVIAYGKDRSTVSRRLAATLRHARIHGVTTNRDLLVGSLLHPDFLGGTASTRFYAANPPSSLITPYPRPDLAALAAALADAAQERGPLLPGVRSGFRNIPVGYRRRDYLAGEAEMPVGYRFGRDGLEVDGLDGVTLVSATADRVELDVDGVRRVWTVGRFGTDEVRVVVDGPMGSLELRRLPRFTDPSARVPAGALTAPMPGTVVRVGVEAGETVTAGQPLVWLEAMKMEHAVRSPAAGTVTALPVTVGQQVTQGTPIAVVTADDVVTADG